MSCSCSDNNSLQPQQVTPVCDNTCPQDCTSTSTALVPINPACCPGLRPPAVGATGQAAICDGSVTCTPGAPCQQLATVTLCGRTVQCCVEIPTVTVTSRINVVVSFSFTDVCGNTVSQCQVVPVELTNRCPVCTADTPCPQFNPCAYTIQPPTIVMSPAGQPIISVTVTTSCQALGL